MLAASRYALGRGVIPMHLAIPYTGIAVCVAVSIWFVLGAP
jgi:hypothetical protein